MRNTKMEEVDVIGDVSSSDGNVSSTFFNLFNGVGLSFPVSFSEGLKCDENTPPSTPQIHESGLSTGAIDSRGLICIFPSEGFTGSILNEQLSSPVDPVSHQLSENNPAEGFSSIPNICSPVTNPNNDVANRVTNEKIATTTVKPKGGWPKGKRRSKRPLLREIAPRAPTTGYVIFLNEKRQKFKEMYPNLPFGEITKLLGNEWSTLQPREKQKYLKQAEDDKKRYRIELKTYQETEAYQLYLKKKYPNIDDISEGKLEEKNFLLTAQDIEEEEVCDLYCKVCNQYFVSLHNKKEHLHGKYHLEALAGEMDKGFAERSDFISSVSSDALQYVQREDVPVFTSLPLESSFVTTKDQVNTIFPTNMNQAIQDIISLNIAREAEIRILTQRLAEARKETCKLKEQLHQLKEIEKQMLQNHGNIKTHSALLSAQLENLRIIPALFGVISF